jgi:GT2 family glycosyltransferase
MTPSRRGSEHWALPVEAAPVEVEVLIPTVGRVAELAVSLAGLAAQDDPPFGVVVADQGPGRPVASAPAVAAMLRLLRAQGRPVSMHRRTVRRGLAEQRQYLLEASSARLVLYLDDDVWLEPGALERMRRAIDRLGCGLVGQAVQGLSYLDDHRPRELEPYEEWGDAVLPERVRPGTPGHARWTLHNAANLAHLAVELGLEPGEWRAYRIAWIGGCVMFDRAALVQSGGFEFWSALPPHHAGEDVVAQWRVMERFGGAGLLPSGALHLEAATTVPDRDVDATAVVLDDATAR